MTKLQQAALALMLDGDYPFPREVYETEEQWKAQGYFQRHPEQLPKGGSRVKREPPEQKEFSLLYRGRSCRVYRTFSPTNGVESKQVQIQFEGSLHTAIVDRSEVKAPDNPRLMGPDV